MRASQAVNVEFETQDDDGTDGTASIPAWNDELADEIKDELDNVILRLNIGKDMHYVTKMQDKYLK